MIFLFEQFRTFNISQLSTEETYVRFAYASYYHG